MPALERSPIGEREMCRVVGGSKNGHQYDMCWDEIGLRVLNVFIDHSRRNT